MAMVMEKPSLQTYLHPVVRRQWHNNKHGWKSNQCNNSRRSRRQLSYVWRTNRNNTRHFAVIFEKNLQATKNLTTRCFSLTTRIKQLILVNRCIQEKNIFFLTNTTLTAVAE